MRLTTAKALLLVCAITLCLAGTASGAGTSPTSRLAGVVDSSTACGTKKLVQPFLPWADAAWYQLVPAGDFETGAVGWALAGDARVYSGSESFFVGSNGDKYSLRLRSGSTAVSPSVCVSIDTPTFRLFVRNGGPADSALGIDVGADDGGPQTWTRVANVAGGSPWQPTQVLAIGVPAFMLTKTGTASVQLRFTPTGSNASWQIDDVYVDPFKR